MQCKEQWKYFWRISNLSNGCQTIMGIKSIGHKSVAGSESDVWRALEFYVFETCAMSACCVCLAPKKDTCLLYTSRCV